MAFTTTWAQATVRRRWSGLLGIALLLGLIGGLGLATTAGARRTQSAYPRFLRSRNPSTLLVDVGSLTGGGADEIESIRRMPEVRQARLPGQQVGRRAVTLRTTEVMVAAHRLYGSLGFHRDVERDMVFDSGFRLIAYRLPLDDARGD